MTRSFRFLIKIDGINSPEDALKFINQSIFIEQEELSSEKLDENESEFYIQDLINMNIFLEGNSEEVAGKVHAVRDFGGGPLIEIAPNLKFKKIFGPNLMFIFNDENFPKIDLEKKEIYLKFPEFCE
jgi:ribosomal 30S subunit maturation factor RimM